MEITTTDREALESVDNLLAQARASLETALDRLYAADRIALDADPHGLSAPYTTHTVSAACETGDRINAAAEAVEARLAELA